MRTMGSYVFYGICLFAVVFSLYCGHGRDFVVNGRGSQSMKDNVSWSSQHTAPIVPFDRNATLPSIGDARHNVSNQWCPKSLCRKQRLCDTCSRRFLIVIAQGRSASTSLIEMLDLLPNVRMGGENDRLVTRFYEDIKLVLERSPYEMKPPGSAWKHNPIEEEDWVCAGQNLIETIYPPKVDEPDDDVILGFKTIRFATANNAFFNISKNVEIYKSMFPCARFLINIRSDVGALTSSRQKAFAAGGDVEALRSNSKREITALQQASILLGKQALLLDSTKWTKDVSVLNQAVSWLGFHETCHFKSLLEFNTVGSYEASKSQLNEFDPRCRYVGKLS